MNRDHYSKSNSSCTYPVQILYLFHTCSIHTSYLFHTHFILVLYFFDTWYILLKYLSGTSGIHPVYFIRPPGFVYPGRGIRKYLSYYESNREALRLSRLPFETTIRIRAPTLIATKKAVRQFFPKKLPDGRIKESKCQSAFNDLSIIHT